MTRPTFPLSFPKPPAVFSAAALLIWAASTPGQENQAPVRGLEIEPLEPPAELQVQPAEGAATVPAPPSLVIPEVPSEYAAEQKLERAFVQRVEIRGNTVLPEARLAAIAASYEHRELSFEQLEALRLELTRAYIDAGYVNSGVVMPDQDVSAGVLRLEVIEGKLQSVAVSGNRNLRRAYIERRLLTDPNKPFNVRDLEASLRLMQQWPLIAQVNAEVVPGNTRGLGVVDLRVRENPSRALTMTYDNHRSPSVGEHEAVVSLVDRSVSGNADYLYGSYGYASGLKDYSLGYGIPLTARDLTVEGYFSRGTSDIVEQPFESLDIVSETRTWGLKVFRPVLRELSHTLTLGLNLEHSSTASTLAGERFSFSVGDQNGKNEVTALRLVSDWTWRGESDAVVVRGTLSNGLNWLGATDNAGCPSLQLPPDVTCPGNLPDSDFLSVLIQAEYAHRFPAGGLQLVLRGTGQTTNEPLLSAEKFAVGGAVTVRGYRENLLVRDEGLVLSLELRAPLFADDIGQSRIGLTLVPFFDYGVAKDQSIDWPGLDDPSADHISSVGAGLLWSYWQWAYVELYYGHALNDVGDGDSLQEDGVHALASLRWSF